MTMVSINRSPYRSPTTSLRLDPWRTWDGVIDKNDINEALHEISMMVSFVLYAVEPLQATDTTPRIFQMPDEAGEMLCFGVFDIDQRVKALRAALYPRGVLNPRDVLS